MKPLALQCCNAKKIGKVKDGGWILSSVRGTPRSSPTTGYVVSILAARSRRYYGLLRT
jgi:hypothetical protein